jgi:hypothetical protein
LAAFGVQEEASKWDSPRVTSQTRAEVHEGRKAQRDAEKLGEGREAILPWLNLTSILLVVTDNQCDGALRTDFSHHAPLAKHLHRLNKHPSPNCPCYGQHNETVEHFLNFCPAHDAARRQLRAASRLAAFTKHLLSDPDLLPPLFRYIQQAGRFHAVFGDFKKLERPGAK